jgi:phosphohistidine phosphatase SixA
MLLMLVRHADAGERDPAQWPDDTLRPLTEKGRKVHARVAKALRESGLIPELVLTSPWLRAALDAMVGPRKGKAMVALVGHSPWLEELAALLLTGTTNGMLVDFPKSGVLGVEADRVSDKGALRFFLRPKLI